MSNIPPTDFPREDRQFGGSQLVVDLIPRDCWFSSARSVLTTSAWNTVKDIVVGRAEKICEVCGGREIASKRRWIEVHERWDYDVSTQTQSLRRLIALCSLCHRSTHFGLAHAQGRGAQAMLHLMKVNTWTPDQAHFHIQQAFLLWDQRNKTPWKTDVTMLTDMGFKFKVKL